MIGLLLLVGLGTDVGRLYVARSELQIYTDEAAIAAAFELDGTAAGLTRARNAAARGPGNGVTPNRWNFGTSAVSGVTTEFASSPAGSFDSNPAGAAGLRYVRVSATAPVNLYFLPLVPGIGGSQSALTSSVVQVQHWAWNPREESTCVWWK